MGAGGAGGEGALEPPPDISGADFELRWSACANRSHALSGQLPPASSLPQTLTDDLETALVGSGFFCVAAGGVGDQFKLYFAGQLRGSQDWLMLEVVLRWSMGTAQVTFRCDAHSQLLPLSETFAGTLATLLRTSLTASY